MDEVDLTETALEALGADVPSVVHALRAGTGLPDALAVALGTDLANRATSTPETAAAAVALAAHPVDPGLLAGIARGMSGSTRVDRSERLGVAYLSDYAPIGSAHLAIPAGAEAAAVSLVTLGAPPAFDAVARSVGATSVASSTLRYLTAMLRGGVTGALIDLHLGVDLDLATANATAHAIVATAAHFDLHVVVRTFRIRVPLGRAFGAALEPLEAAQIIDGGGPIAVRRFVDQTIAELVRLDGRNASGASTAHRTPSVETVDVDAPVRRAITSETAGSVLRLDAATVVAVSRLVSGVRVVRTVGEHVGRNDTILEVLGDDDITVERAVDALRGAWSVGPGSAPGPDPTPISVVRTADQFADSPLFFGS